MYFTQTEKEWEWYTVNQQILACYYLLTVACNCSSLVWSYFGCFRGPVSSVILPSQPVTHQQPQTEASTSKTQDNRGVQQKWKFGLIQCLLHRAYTIGSSWLTFSQEVDVSKGCFLTKWISWGPVRFMLEMIVNNKCDKSIQNSKIKEDRVDTIFFIPYNRIVFTSFKVKNYFSLKCRTPLPLLANVVL